MKKKIFGAALIAAMAVAAGLNFNQSKNEINLTDLTLANVEALARSETDDEFTQKTCCVAIWENRNCSGCDGNTHTYAERR